LTLSMGSSMVRVKDPINVISHMNVINTFNIPHFTRQRNTAIALTHNVAKMCGLSVLNVQLQNHVY